MQLAVIGLGRFGSRVAEVATARGVDVLAIDSDAEICEELKDKVTQTVTLDCTDERSLRAVGIQDMDVVVVAIGTRSEASIMTTAILRRMGLRRIVARAVSALQAEILKEVGASEVVFLESQMGEQIAARIIAPHFLERIPLGARHGMAEMRPLKEFVGKRLKEIEIRSRYGLNIIAIKRRTPALTDDGESSFEEAVNDMPGPEDVIREGDVLVVVGPMHKLDTITRSREED